MTIDATSSDSLTKDASAYSNAYLDTTGKNGGGFYRRKATNPILQTISTATDLGDLVYDQTQLNVTAQVSAANPENIYMFDLDGDSLKTSLYNYTSGIDLRAQIMDSNGKVIADSSEYASDTLQAAFKSADSPTGLDLDAGRYYVKVTVDITEKKSVAQSYELSLYSGDFFRNSYSTIAASQIKSTQHVVVDNTMVFSTLNALSFSNDDVHRANASIDSPINIGWLYENKSSLSVRSMLTAVAEEHFYSITLQKGDALKFALDERTDDGFVRIQLMDPSGTYIYADSHGTEEQQEAYAEFTSEDGLDSQRGQYIIKASFILGKDKSTDMEYDFKLYVGDRYESIYQTNVTTETADTALLQGSFVSSADYNPITALASYMQAEASGSGTNIMDTLKSKFS